MRKIDKTMTAIVSLVLIVQLMFTAYSFTVSARLCLVGIAAIIFEFAVLAVYICFFARRRGKGLNANGVWDSISSDLFMRSSNPIAIVTQDGAIAWNNSAFTERIADNNDSDGQKLSDYLPAELCRGILSGETNDRAPEVRLGGGVFRLDSYGFDGTQSDSMHLVQFTDRSEIDSLKSSFAAANPIVMYIAIDNYSEVTGSKQEKYRAIEVKISELLEDWVEKMNGILREIDRERYIVLLEEHCHSDITAEKYDILDRIRALSGDSVDIPLTVSIGTACIDGTLAEKERSADQALNLALQRGGDQAVVKGRTNTEFYGGRTKTVQKRTKIRSRIIAGELTNMFKKADNVLIMGHKYADHDSIGSCVGVARLAMRYSDKVNIVVNIHDVNLKGIFQKLRGIPDYKNVFVDSSTAQDMISTGTVLVVMDVNNYVHFESPELYENCENVVIIDHHRKSGDFPIEPKLAYIEPSASSASELVTEILEQVIEPGGLLKEEAELLFSGIILDTKQFTRNTGVRTFSAALYLRGEGASPGEAQMLFKTDLSEFMREVKFETNIVIYRDIIAISTYDGQAEPGDKIAASKAAERLLSVEGVLASFTLCTIDNTVHVSARSTGTVNVQLILENMGGGGHFDSAGAQLRMSMTAALKSLKEAIDSYLNED
ncbi:MAG: DHH family phosphoesterase [Firmicutes bacterium]|nr:DHH family phosphoesterase [Bacillota bacterium]